MDLDPESGSYRLTASVPGVCLNELRKTLGIRPPPYPLAGALRGVLHCSGPLDQPVFAGAWRWVQPEDGIALCRCQACVRNRDCKSPVMHCEGGPAWGSHAEGDAQLWPGASSCDLPSIGRPSCTHWPHCEAVIARPAMRALASVHHATSRQPISPPLKLCEAGGSCAGTAVTTKASPKMLEAMEASPAKAALVSEPEALAAYDRVPCKAVSAVFTLDTSTDIFLLHTLQAWTSFCVAAVSCGLVVKRNWACHGCMELVSGVQS